MPKKRKPTKVKTQAKKKPPAKSTAPKNGNTILSKGRRGTSARRKNRKKV